jgi:hypothetical protein
MRTRTLVLPAFIFVVLISAVGLWMDLLVLEIGSPELVVPVSEGDVFFRTYINSMYEAPVSEKFKIEDGHLRLVHVQTQSDAALAYLGIERKNEPNADEKLTEFSIPAASIGNHVLRFRDCDIPLGTGEGRDGSVRVRLARVSLLAHFVRPFWR